MTDGSQRLDRIERILEEVAKSQDQVTKSQREMAARQQYHDEAFERHDAEMKVIREAIAADAENIRALARITELHH
jgi:cell division septum initiation protein DivIVA